MDISNTNNDNNSWKVKIRQTKVQIHRMFEVLWERDKPETVKMFLEVGASLQEAKKLTADMKIQLLKEFKRQQKEIFLKIAKEKVNEYIKRKGILSEEDKEKREDNPSSKLTSAASSSQATEPEPSGSSAAASYNNESNALTYPSVASRVLSPAKAKSSGDRNGDEKDRDDEEPPVKSARFKQ